VNSDFKPNVHLLQEVVHGLCAIAYTAHSNVQCAVLLHYVRGIPCALNDANYSLLQNVRPILTLDSDTTIFSSDLDRSHDPAEYGLGDTYVTHPMYHWDLRNGDLLRIAKFRD